MATAAVSDIIDNFDLTLFLHRGVGYLPEYLSGTAIRSIVTRAIDGCSWVCGKCGRANSSDVYSCQGCNAPRVHGKHRGKVSLEAWFPNAAVFYGVDVGFSLYVMLRDCGRPDDFDSQMLVYHLENCKIEKMDMIDVLDGMREVGQCPERVTMRCEIECDVIFVGEPWDSHAKHNR